MNTDNLYAAMDHLEAIIKERFDIYFNKTNTFSIPEIDYVADDHPLYLFLQTQKPSMAEFVALLMALAPHLKPDYYSHLLAQYFPQGGDFPAFGGTKGQNHRGILPTGETAQFILAGNDLAKRIEVQQMFSADHWFAKKGILSLEAVKDGEPPMSGKLILDPEWVEEITTGKVSAPTFSMRFPAERLQSEMTWDDLVLPGQTLEQIKEIETWLLHHQTLLNDWEMGRKLKPGYRVLFHGPPGTGKTLTAALLGQSINKPVYKVDLSMVVSKFIGETEKNLSSLFAKAENKDWILFFDEADALFGKRTNVRDAHDKYANQEVSYLLQRVEGFNGLVILASNFKNNIDDAFTRRFQSIIHFPIPGPKERLLLWEKGFPKEISMDSKVNLELIAKKYELTGAMIMNIIQYVCLKALSEEEFLILECDILAGIRKEFLKRGKMVR